MLRYGYDRRVASGVIAASGTLAQIISALAGPDRDGRPTRPLGRGHVRGGIPSRPHARRPLCRLRISGDVAVSQIRSRFAHGGDRISRGRRQTRPALPCGSANLPVASCPEVFMYSESLPSKALGSYPT